MAGLHDGAGTSPVSLCRSHSCHASITVVIIHGRRLYCYLKKICAKKFTTAGYITGEPLCLEPQPHVAVHVGVQGLVEPHHACESGRLPQRGAQQFRVVVRGAFRYPGTVQCDQPGARGPQYAPHLGYLLHDLGLVTEMHGVAGECVRPLAPVVYPPFRCQLFVAILFTVGIHAPDLRMRLFEPVVATADVHATLPYGQGVQQVVCQPCGVSLPCVLPGCDLVGHVLVPGLSLEIPHLHL